MRSTVVLSSLPSVLPLLPYLPKDEASVSFRKTGIDMLNARLALGTKRRDIFTHLLGEDTETNTRFNRAQLAANAHLLVVAGTDTVSSLVSNIFRELALNPSMQATLYEEVKAAMDKNGELTCATVKSLPYLQAVIDETLRLWNPVPSGVQAMTGHSGITIAGSFIPPRTVVRVAHSPMMLDPRYFPRPEEFWPERWLEGRQGVKEIRAFIPFS
jgi:cytochrome P450